MRLPHLTATHLSFFALAALAASVVVARGVGGVSDPPSPTVIGESIYIGQVYPSGRLYLEGFGRGDEALAPGGWPEFLRFIPLDPGARSAVPGGGGTGAARFRTIEHHMSPPVVEGMLPAESPCVPEEYRPRAGAGYVGGSGPLGDWSVPWEGAEYFATNQWFGCGSEPAVAVYEVEGEIATSFRVLAFHPEVPVDRPDWGVVGVPRPLTVEEAERVAQRRARNHDCTLQPRDREAARQLLRFDLVGTPHQVSLSSYVTACTSLGEVFILDLLADGQPIETYDITRWRGDP